MTIIALPAAIGARMDSSAALRVVDVRLALLETTTTVEYVGMTAARIFVKVVFVLDRK